MKCFLCLCAPKPLSSTAVMFSIKIVLIARCVRVVVCNEYDRWNLGKYVFRKNRNASILLTKRGEILECEEFCRLTDLPNSFLKNDCGCDDMLSSRACRSLNPWKCGNKETLSKNSFQLKMLCALRIPWILLSLDLRAVLNESLLAILKDFCCWGRDFLPICVFERSILLVMVILSEMMNDSRLSRSPKGEWSRKRRMEPGDRI